MSSQYDVLSLLSGVQFESILIGHFASLKTYKIPKKNKKDKILIVFITSVKLPVVFENGVDTAG